MKPLLLALLLLGRDELSDAIAKLQQGYAFTLEAKNETIPGREHPLEIDGAWTKDAPLRAVSGDIEMLRGKSLAWKSKGGEWTKYDPKAGIRGDEQKRASLLQRVAALRPPHEELAAVAKALKNAKKGKDGLVEGDLEGDACLDVLSDGRLQPMLAAHTGHAGKVKIWIDKGAVAKIELAVTWTETYASHVGEHKTAVTWRKTTTFKGAVKIEIPDAARKLLE